MKKLLLFTICLFSVSMKAQNLIWAKQLGGTNDEISKSIAVDASGNVYTTGAFRGTVDFDPGAATFTLTSSGDWDVYVSKLDANGNFLWAKRFGSSGANDDQAFSITLDASNNVYTTGYFRSTVDFDPGAATFTLTSSGNRDVFINVLDASGNFIRAKKLGGPGDDVGYSIAVNGAGQIYTCGYFNGTADFDPSVATNTLISTGGNDIFICQLDQFGGYVWASQIGSVNGDVATCLTLDASSNLVVAGYFQGTADFNPSASTFTLANVGSGDVFVSKFTGSGSFIWAKSMGGINFDRIESVTTDASFNIYTTGYFGGTADFDPAAATYTLASAGLDDIFVSKLDVSGNFVWAKSMGGTGVETGYSIDVDATGNVYTTGSYYGTCDFDPSAATYTVASVAGNLDFYISKLDASGNFVWAKSMGGSSDDIGYSLTIDAAGAVYTTGTFMGTVDFDPNAGIVNLIAPGFSSEVFVHKTSSVGTDIAETSGSIPVLIYPNPAYSTLNIKTTETLEAIHVYNLLGSLVLEEKNNSFSVEQLPAGVYTLQIKTQNGMGTTRFVKE